MIDEYERIRLLTCEGQIQLNSFLYFTEKDQKESKKTLKIKRRYLNII